MTSSNKTTIAAGLATLLLTSALAIGCGNYSNEDLEYMNALPEGDDLAADLPQAQSAVLAQTAELYRLTHDVTRGFNGTLEAFLRLINAVRSYSPSTRTPTSRIWGPFPDDKHPGWMVKMEITRPTPVSNQFAYRLGFLPVSNRNADLLVLIDGTFEAVGGIRLGVGTLNVDTRAVRAAGIEVNLGFLSHMEMTYNTTLDPITVDTTLTNFPNPLKADELLSAVYHYQEWQDQRGRMVFDFKSNGVPGPAIETFNVVSRWLGEGPGRSDVQVVEGDAAGTKWAQCWDRDFQAVFTNKPWAPAENVGDPSACPNIPAL